MTVSSSDEGTNHYVCDKCGKACDWVKETSAQRLRRDKEYYQKELKSNAKRREQKGYDLGRNEEILKNHKKRRAIVSRYVKVIGKRWTDYELDFLREHISLNSDYSAVAIFLGRSLGSVEHKVIRMGLRKNNKYK